VITDVDGTLVNGGKRLTSWAFSAVAELRGSGIVFSIISSRPPRGFRPLLGPIGITTPVASFNGVIAATDLSVITEHLLSPAVARRALDMLDAQRVQVWVFSGQDWLPEITVIGDGGNDGAMFERSDLSIAMGNASPEARRTADFVTDSNREEGFANAVERFILGGHERVEVARVGGRAC
jgi:hydroxymethylpyrimidine pyrophosphatase-like HAD family hydrolase